MLQKTSLILRAAHAYRLKRQSTLALTITRTRELIKSRWRRYVCYGHCCDSPIQLTPNMSTGLVIVKLPVVYPLAHVENRGSSGKDLKQALDCLSVI